METNGQLRPSEEWQNGWKLVLACFVGFSFFSFMTASIGAFMRPLGQEFGWSRTLLSAGVAIASVTAALLSPLVGAIIDRYGSRRVALPGIVATTAAICAFSLNTGSPTYWLAIWGFYAVLSISVKTTVWTTAIAATFRSARGLALGITLSGTAAAQAIVPPLVTWLIDTVGWRSTYVWLGCGWGGLTMLLSILFLRVEHSGPVNEPTLNAPTYGLTRAEALRNSALHRIGLATFIMITVTIGLLIHKIAILTAIGVSPIRAAWLVSLSGVAGIVGKLVTGFLLDRYSSTLTGGITLAVTAVGFLLLLGDTHSEGIVILAMVILGYAAGTALQVGSYLTILHAGMRNFGSIYGVLTSLVAMGSGIGPLLAGISFDLAGNYTPFLMAGAVGSLISSLLIWSIPPSPDWQSEPQKHPAAEPGEVILT